MADRLSDGWTEAGHRWLDAGAPPIKGKAMAEVTQADREAAARWAKAQSRHQQAANMLRGSCDTAPLVQAFARHRTEAVKPLVEAARAILPTNVAIGNAAWPDSTVLPLDVTLGELRALDAALRSVHS